MFNKFWFEAKNINCFKNGFRVIKDLNLKIAYSENVILIGPNGSGKSSLIEIMNRNIYPVVTDESKLKIFDEDYMILKTQTYNHNMGYVSKDEIKLLGEDRIINYFWKWYKKSEDKDEPWRNINKTQNLNVYDKVIMKYPPEVKKLEIINNINIIRKTFIRFAAPLIFFMLII